MKRTSLTILSILLSLAVMATASDPEFAKAQGEKAQTEAGSAKAQPKGSKGAKYLKKKHTGRANFTTGGKRQYWFTGNAYSNEYVRFFLNGKKMEGSVKVEVFAKSKRILTRTVDFNKDKLVWVEPSKRVKGDYYIKVTPIGKKSLGIVTVRNVTVTRKEKLNKDMLKLVNEARGKEGLPPCFWDESLEKGVLVRAKELGAKFSHDRPDGSKCFTAFDEIMGESITSEPETERGFNMWMNSPGHRELIMAEWSDERAKNITYGFACASSSYGSVMVVNEYIEY